MECYDFKEDRWNHLRLQWFRSTNHSFDACLVLSEMPGRRCRCGVAVVRGRVYGVGGFNGSLRVRKTVTSVLESVLLSSGTLENSISILSTLGSMSPLE